MATPIDRESYRAALEWALAQKGADFIYVKPEGARTCQYMEGKNPSCIHAYALHNLGYTDLTEYEGVSVEVILDDLGVDDESLVRSAVKAQYAQDKGYSWGAAVKVFDSELSNPVGVME